MWNGTNGNWNCWLAAQERPMLGAERHGNSELSCLLLLAEFKPSCVFLVIVLGDLLDLPCGKASQLNCSTVLFKLDRRQPVPTDCSCWATLSGVCP